MQTIIRWKTGVFHADPAKCYQEITEIGTEVTPEQVLQKAEDTSTELNKCFNWNDEDCARRYRLFQARNVMNSLIVITRPDEHESIKPMQFRMLVKNENHAGSGYKQMLAVVQNEDEYQKLLKQAEAELQVFKQKYSCLTELAEIIALIP